MFLPEGEVCNICVLVTVHSYKRERLLSLPTCYVNVIFDRFGRNQSTKVAALYFVHQHVEIIKTASMGRESNLHDRIFHSPVVFTVLLGVTIFVYVAAIGAYTAGILTTIQREFKLKSSEVGLLFSINDIVSIIMVTPLAYLGTSRHRPRIIGILTIVFALGCYVSILPQFIGHDNSALNPNNPSTNSTMALANVSSTSKSSAVELCRDDTDAGNATDTGKCSKEELAASGAQFHRAVWLIIGQALCGIGSASYVTLGVTYIDDGVAKKSSSLYFGFLFMIVSISPVVAFGISAVSLSFHTDFYKIDELGYGDDDPRWIGAWWLGFLIFGVTLTICSIPYFFFPKNWPDKKRDVELSSMDSTDADEKESVDASDVFIIKPPSSDGHPSSILGLAKGYLVTMLRLASNITYMTIVIASIAQAAMFSGLFSFGGRYLQTQYDITPAMTSVILGCVTSPSIFVGNFISGWLLKKLKLEMRGILTACILISSATLLICTLFFAVACETSPIAGINTPYLVGDNNSAMLGTNTPPTCMNDCACSTGTYTPVCGSDGLTYVTPCHAGCKEYGKLTKHDDAAPSTPHIYSECACVSVSSTASQENDVYGPFTAVLEKCPSDCFAKRVAFLVLLASLMLIVACIHIPVFMLYMRCVEEQDRAVSLGLASLLGKVLAYVPAPIYFGAAIQTTCLMFQESCGRTGNCLLYDNERLTRVLFGLVIILKVASLLMYVCSYVSLRRNESGVYQQMQLCKSEKEPVDDV